MPRKRRSEMDRAQRLAYWEQMRAEKTTLLCTQCGESKGCEAFLPSDWRRAVRKSWCRECRGKKVMHGYYAKHRPTVLARQQSLRDRVSALKAALGCKECGESHPACLDFHHRDPLQKRIAIGTMVCRSATMDKVLAEIQKCDVLCANCHRKHHHGQRRPRRSKVTEASVLPFPQQHLA